MPKGETNHKSVPIIWDDEGPTDTASRLVNAMAKGKVYTLAQLEKVTGYQRSCISRTLGELAQERKVRRGEQVISGKRVAVYTLK